MPNENISAEKLRILDVIKENAMTFIFIAGLMWSVISFVVLPIKQLEYSVGTILNNHLKTIQDHQIIATQERKQSTEVILQIQKELIKIQVHLEK